MYYARINNEGICDSMVEVHSEIKSPNMIEIKDLTERLEGKRFNQGKWEDVPVVPPPPPATPKAQGTTNEEIKGHLLVVMEALAKLSEATPGAVSSDLMAALVKAGKRTLDQVPAAVRPEVELKVK